MQPSLPIASTHGGVYATQVQLNGSSPAAASAPRDKAKVVPIGGGPSPNAGLASLNGAAAAALIDVGPGGGAGAGGVGAGAGDRTAASVHGGKHWFWLHFVDRWLEEQYELLLDVSVPAQARLLFWGVLVLGALGMIFDGVYFSGAQTPFPLNHRIDSNLLLSPIATTDDTTAYTIRLVLLGVTLFLAVLQFVLRHTRISLFWLCVMFGCCGVAWSVRSVLFNASAQVLRPTESGE
jgi:hypothetical protein